MSQIGPTWVPVLTLTVPERAPLLERLRASLRADPTFGGRHIVATAAPRWHDVAALVRRRNGILREAERAAWEWALLMDDDDEVLPGHCGHLCDVADETGARVVLGLSERDRSDPDRTGATNPYFASWTTGSLVHIPSLLRAGGFRWHGGTEGEDVCTDLDLHSVLRRAYGTHVTWRHDYDTSRPHITPTPVSSPPPALSR